MKDNMDIKFPNEVFDDKFLFNYETINIMLLKY